ncbi:MAG: shikimate kinase [Deltaproteobacteria bacterium]|nr:shikimate kinase [Deltaproteobacteria bacterium]MBT4526894.1 shikimate kinase [Deltaproteobacteria bacterium]
MNIVLIGFMGAGKTTIGRKTAARLGYWFVDMDYQIERSQNARVTEIFEKHGQQYFRALETKLLKQLTKVENTVVATGGGVLTTEGNLALINQIGTSVYLNASVEMLFERATRTDKRPLLRTENPFQTMSELFEKRKHLYQQADITITTEELKLHFVINEMIRQL